MHIICWKINKFKGVEGLKIRGAHTNTRAVCLTSISLDICVVETNQNISDCIRPAGRNLWIETSNYPEYHVRH